MNDRNLLEYAKALSKRRKGGAWPCSSRSILEPEERQTLLALLRRIDRRSTAIYAATQLRGLVDLPEALPARDKQHWSRSVVSFALIDIDSRTWSVRLVVVAADANADLLRMLQDAGVPHVQMVAGVTPELQASLILEHADAQSRLQSLRGSSHSQRLIAQQIREALCLLPSVHVSQVADEDLTLSDKEMRDHLVSDVEAENWVLLEEVGLQRLVEFPGCQDKAIREFICRSSVDAVLVSTQGEEARPILVIEFDGPHHDHLNARKRDQVKDALLADAKIPLLRVSHLDVNIKHWRRASSEERHDMSGYLRPMQQLVRRLVGESEALRRYMGERQRCSDHAVRERDSIASAMYGKPFSELRVDERHAVEAQDSVVDSDIQLQSVETDMDLYVGAEIAAPAVEEELRRVGLDGKIVDLEILNDPRNSWGVTAKYVSQDGTACQLVGPQFSINFPSVDRPKLDRIVRRYLIEQIAQAAADLH